MLYGTTHMWNLRENGIKDLLCRAETETQTNEWMDAEEARGGVGGTGRLGLTHKHQ